MANEIYHRSNWGNAVNDKYWADVYEKYSATNKMYIRSDYYENSNETDKLMADIYPKPSILLTPTAYDNGSLHSVKPVKTFGSELISNGDFSDGLNNWTDTSNWWSVVNGQAYHPASTSIKQLYQDVSTEVNKKYKISVNVNIISGTPQVFWDKVSGQEGQNLAQGFNEIIVTTFRTSSNIYFGRVSPTNAEFYIDNVSVKEIIDGDFNFTRGSSATRVNEKGLIEDVQILSGNLVQNGDFSEEGSELVINGDFSDGLNSWAIHLGDPTVSNGEVHFTGDLIRQSILTIGKTYKVTVSVTEVNSGLGKIQLGASVVLFSGLVEKQTFYVTATDNINFYIGRNSNTDDFKIDNVSVKEVGQNWTFESGWGMGDGEAVATSGSGTASKLIQTNTLNGKYAKVSLDVSNYGGSGVILVDFGSTNSPYILSNGTHILYGTYDQNDFQIYKTDSFSGSIDNISVIEITEDTDLPRINYTNFDYEDVLGDELVTNGSFSDDSDWVLTGATINGGKVNVNSSSPVYIIQNNVATVGKLYKVELTVSNYVEGDLRLRYPFTISESEFTGNGTYVFYGTAEDARFELQGRFSGQTYNYSIDNVSVKEFTENVVAPYSGTGSLLLEPQSTNLVTYSEDFSQWSTLNGSSVDLNFAISPDGTQNASKFNFNGTTNGRVELQITGLTPAQPVTFSVWLKTLSGTEQVYIGHSSFGLKEVTVTDQWQRYTSSTISGASGGAFPRVRMDSASSVLVWGYQVEEQSFSTSYIPTNGEVNGVTRLADLCNNAGSSDLINSTEGVLYAEIAALADDGINRSISLSDGDVNNRISLLFGTSSNRIRAIVKSNGSTSFDEEYEVTSTLDYHKVAIKYKLNNFALWIDSVERFTDTSGSTPIGLNKLMFDIGSGILPFYGKAKAVAVFKEALNNDQLERLTGEGYETFNLLAQANNYTII